MNSVQVAAQELQANAHVDESVVQLSEAEIQLIAGGTAITNSI